MCLVLESVMKLVNNGKVDWLMWGRDLATKMMLGLIIGSYAGYL